MTQNDLSKGIVLEVPYGNGRSMKFFNLFYKYYLVWFIIGTFYTLNNIYSIIMNNYQGNYALFYSIRGNLVALFFGFLGFILELMILRAALKKEPQQFSILFLANYPLSILGQFIGVLFYIQQNPTLTNDYLNQLIPIILLQVLAFIPLFIYFKKRFKK